MVLVQGWYCLKSYPFGRVLYTDVGASLYMDPTLVMTWAIKKVTDGAFLIQSWNTFFFLLTNQYYELGN
jgi:hypothetical protein